MESTLQRCEGSAKYRTKYKNAAKRVSIAFPIDGAATMAYAQGYQFDLFISYAHVDNEPVSAGALGWVSQFVHHLRLQLARKLGRSDTFKIWFDERNVAGNAFVTEHIPEKVHGSALYLAVESPGYVRSEWCLRELQHFVDSHPDAAKSERLFLIEHAQLSKGQQRPDALQNLRGYRFWYPDEKGRPRTYADPQPIPTEREYYGLIAELAQNIADKLNENAPRPERLGTVLLAQVTDDLERQRSEVRRYLNQAGIDVLPTATYPLNCSDFEKAFASDAAKCAAFVQLLGPIVGLCPPDVRKGFGWLQFELAKRHALPILQWRPDLDMANDVESPVQRELLKLETVQARPFEDFKQSIVDTVVKILRPPPAPPAPAGEHTSLIFINADAVDMANAEAISKCLDGHVGWAMSLHDPTAKAEEVQAYTEKLLIDCDGLVIVYGETRPLWVTSQLQLYRKLAPQREKETRVLAVVEAPPEPKTPIPMGLPRLATIKIEKVANLVISALSS